MVDVQKPIGLSAPAAPDAAKAPDNAEQLRTLAAQFESVLLGQMMKEMRSSMFDDGEEKETGFGGNPLSESLYSELSLALSRAGGVGLGESLAGPLLRQADVSGTEGAGRATSIRSLGALPTAPALLPMAAPAIEMPVAGPIALPGRVSSSYGWRKDPVNGAAKFHKGTDIAMPVGQDVPSARAGEVSFAGQRSGYGLTVEVDHGDGRVTRYAHLSQLTVKAGDAVAAGQVIAKSGASGRVTGPHLHFEVLEDGQAVDPSAWLSPSEQ